MMSVAVLLWIFASGCFLTNLLSSMAFMDTSYIDRLYNSWLKHRWKKLKSFQMGGAFEYQFSFTDELATKLDKMGLVIRIYS